MATLPYILLALLVIGIIIFMHELGHYLAARATGIGVTEFAMGFGPKLVSWRRGRTLYSIRLFIPLGGFCKFVGEDEAENWYPVPYAGGFTPHSPALAAGMRAGDILKKVGDTDLSFDEEGANVLLGAVNDLSGTLTIVVERDGALIPLSIRPQTGQNEAQLGIMLGRVDDCSLPRVIHTQKPCGLKPGDLIVKIGREYIEYGPGGAAKVNRKIDQRKGPLTFTVERTGQTLVVSADPGSLTLGRASFPLPGDDAVGPPMNPFNKQKVFKRIITVFAGPFMNFALAFVAAVALYISLSPFYYAAPLVHEVSEGSSAMAAGMESGDQILTVNGEAIEFSEAGEARVREIITGTGGEAIDFVVARNGERVPLTLAPQETQDGYKIGVTLGYLYHLSFGEAVQSGLNLTKDASTAIVKALRALVTTGEGIEETAGPVGLVSVMSQQAQTGGMENVIYMLVVISINLGIMNLLPLPALDGGRLVFLAVEGVRRKPVKPEHEALIHAAGFILFMALFVVITYRDIAKLISGITIGG